MIRYHRLLEIYIKDGGERDNTYTYYRHNHFCTLRNILGLAIALLFFHTPFQWTRLLETNLVYLALQTPSPVHPNNETISSS